MERDFLNMERLCRDFFGAEEEDRADEGQGPDAPQKQHLPVPEDAQSAGGLSSEEELLARAREALKAAKVLFGETEAGGAVPESDAQEGSGRPEAPVKKPEAQDFGGAQGAKPLSSCEAAGTEAQEETDPMEELSALVGLERIKHDVKELVDFIRVQQLRKQEGLKAVPVSLHLVFTGNPGTGKTTVARIIAKLYKQIGVLKEGQLVEVDRSGLVAGYVGQTAIKTAEQIEKAIGGVLFIDEAYALSKKDDPFGQEAIDTILKAMEDRRDEFVVIVAGYTKPMERFISSNPGLRSRFNKYIEFPDYSVDELEEIFKRNCAKYDYRVEEEAEKHIRELLVSAKLAQGEDFANAREVRNLFEKIITNQAHRLAAADKPSQEEMMTIRSEDLKELTEGAAGSPEEQIGETEGSSEETGG